MITQPRMLFEDMRSPPLPQRRGLTRPASSAASSAAAKMLAAAFGVLLLLEDAKATLSPSPTPLDSQPSGPTAAPSGSETCGNGVTGVENEAGEVCCPTFCGDVCGGSGCGEIGADDCCAGNIWRSNIYCGTAPCIIGANTPAPAATSTPSASPTTPAPEVEATDTTSLTSISSLQAGVTPAPTPSPSAASGSGGELSPDTGLTPTNASSEEGVAMNDILAIAVVGSFFVAVLVVTCTKLRSHCSASGKSIRGSFETLLAKGSFWGANFLFFGVLVTLNIYNFSSLWGVMNVFISVVLWVLMFAWFVAFKIGTPATVSLECACRICICRRKPSSSLPTERPRPDFSQAVDCVEEAPY